VDETSAEADATGDKAGADEARDIGAVVDMAVKIRSDSVSRRVQ
jgi:hypothetical protein